MFIEFGIDISTNSRFVRSIRYFVNGLTLLVRVEFSDRLCDDLVFLQTAIASFSISSMSLGSQPSIVIT